MCVFKKCLSVFGCAGPLLHGLSLVEVSGGYSLVVVCGLLITVDSLVVPTSSRAHSLQELRCMDSAVVVPGFESTGSIIVAQGLSSLWHVGSSWTRD